MLEHARRLAAVALLAAGYGRADTPMIPQAIKLIEPTEGTRVDLPKTVSALIFRWKIPVEIAKALAPGKTLFVATKLQLQDGTFIPLDQAYLGPLAPANDIHQVIVSRDQFLTAAKAARFDLSNPIRLNWKVELRTMDQAIEILGGQGFLGLYIPGTSALDVSVAGYDDNYWPTGFTVKNDAPWPSNPTTLNVTVRRFNDNVDLVKQYCPIRLANFSARVPKLLNTPYTVPALKPPPLPMQPPAPAAISAISKAPQKAAGAASAPPTPGPPPPVQKVVNCRFDVLLLLPNSDNPRDQNMKPDGLRGELWVENQVMLP